MRHTGTGPTGPRPRSVRLTSTVTVLLLSIASLVISGTVSRGVTPVAATKARNPLAAAPFYVDPATWAEWAVKTYPESATENEVIASTPQARWIGDWTPTNRIRAEVDRYVSAATEAEQLPVLVLYAIPHRDCGGFSSGGLSGPKAYARWVSQVVQGIDGRRVGVVVEPDALAGLDCLSAADRKDRYAMLKSAVKKLSASTRTAVYLDAGHSEWLSAPEAARRLNVAGVSRARGFSLNVSNFLLTEDEVAYGERVAALTGGKHYVIDTSRNGQGPAPAAPLNWCNPEGRGLGVPPTTATTGKHADAYLWVKHPGESDGECDRGDPVSGTWFDAYAVGLVQRAQTG